MDNSIPTGLYEAILDECLEVSLAAAREKGLAADVESLESHDHLHLLAQHLRRQIQHNIAAQRDPSDRVAMCNLLLDALSQGEKERCSRLVDPPQLLLSLVDPKSSATAPGNFQLSRPQSPMSQTSLFTGVAHEPQLASELEREFASADRVDILCSFIKWSGLRILLPAIKAFLAREGTELRVLTTSYMGATDYEAIECLAELPRTSVRFSLDTRRTRMHAKAYLFHRNTGYTTAYIGSSNMSEPAMTSGLEWNLKVTQVESPHIIEKFVGTIETYWQDDEFQAFAPDTAPSLERALAAERAHDSGGLAFLFDIRPYPYQSEVLDRLIVERTVHGRWKNLIVAATGTGKTVIAALDFKRFLREQPDRRARLLFIAHREEILRQSLGCFRAVLRDPNFGELMFGQHNPSNLDVLFCSIQSYNSKDLRAATSADFYDYVIVDEFHHASAPSYRSLFDYFRPRILLGLTATPERSDGQNVATMFFDGHIAAEIRLHEAIRRKLLCPFQYFGATDPVDLSGVSWSRGRYDQGELETLYVASNLRATVVVDQLREKVRELSKPIGIGFCVSVRHATYMAEFFNNYGIRADFLTGESSEDDRKEIRHRLTRREINFVFVVDLYNEGVDIPEVDTVLFLRPTESLTLFLQQLGRGLRLAEGKDCLTVLDFMGQAHRQFDFEQRFRALLGRTERRVDQELVDGFPHVPPGCSIQLEKCAQQYVLENIRRQLRSSKPGWVGRIRRFAEETGKELTLANFLTHYDLTAEALYAVGTWSDLCVQAQVRSPYADPDAAFFRNGLKRLSRSNSQIYLRFAERAIRQDVELEVASVEEQRMSIMLYYAFCRGDSKTSGLRSFEEFIARLAENPTLRSETAELIAWNLDHIGHVERVVKLPYPCPLRLHSDYHLDEILAAFGSQTISQKRHFREGVLYIEDLKTDLLFVTLNKSEKNYSPTTLYKDYAISEHLIHWETQSTTSYTSPTGRHYLSHGMTGNHILLFVRREPKTATGQGSPYTFLGSVAHVSHSGSRPIAIVWRLQTAIPAALLLDCRKLAAG